MKERIRDLQINGNEEVIQSILNRVDDVKDMKYKGNVSVNNPLDFVSNRIRAMIVKSVMLERQKDIRIRTEITHEWYDDLWEYISGLADADWINLDYKEIANFKFDSVYREKEDIMNYLGWGIGQHFFSVIDKFKAMNSLEGNELMRGSYTERKDDWLPLFEEALRHSLMKVDVNRTDKEIISYTNKAMMTKFIELQMKRDGTKRIRRGNESVYINVETDSTTDAWLLLFKKTVKYVGGIDRWNLYLNERQMDFIKRVHAKVQEDLDNNNKDAFRWKQDGSPVVIKRHLAEYMNMSETNFKQTLKRIEKKVIDNWEKAVK